MISTPAARRASIALLLLLVGSRPGGATPADVPTPESHLGFRPGADSKLAHWPAVVEYFRKVDDASDRVVVRELGRSTEDRPFVVAVVSSPDTVRDLDRAKQLQHQLADPRLKVEEGVDPARDAKCVVLITCSIHSTETASTLMAMELLHELATRDDAATREILANTVLLLVPSVNPDGVEKVAAWYERTLGRPWEGGGMVELYHPYAGHDTNRDWFMLNLKETQLLTRMLYKEWYPTLTYDVHQMGPKGARIFVPPFFDPINPNLEAWLNQGIALIGAHMAADLAAEGKRGVLTKAMYDNWWNGGNRTTPQRHNMVGVLTEVASVRMASPIFLEKSELGGVTRGFENHNPAVNFPDPWPGGWWRLRDIVEYELTCSRSLLTLAARYRGAFQKNYRELGLKAIERGRAEPPFAWVVPADQRDPGTAAEMVRILHDTGIEVRRSPSEFRAQGLAYPAGSWILRADQPYRPHLKDMMERQTYPDRFTASGAAEPPYDVAGWTLPLQMGVRVAAVSEPFETKADLVAAVEKPRGRITGPANPVGYALKNESNDDFLAVNALLVAGAEVHLLLKAQEFGGKKLPAGTLVIKADARARQAIDAVLPAVSGDFLGIGAAEWPDLALDQVATRVLPRRIGVYQPWQPSMDEGWTRLVLEKFRFPYQTLHNADIRSGRLRDRVDVLLIPAVPPRSIREGYAADQTEPPYTGGLGVEGAQALRTFVADGGVLVALEKASEYAIEELDLPVASLLKGIKTSEFYGPGSILAASKGTPSLLTVGMPEEFSVYFDKSLAFRPNDTKVVSSVSYGTSEVLQSGWLLGPGKIQGKSALVEIPVGDGSVILFAFPPQNRAQPHGTFRLLFNALLLGGKRLPAP